MITDVYLDGVKYNVITYTKDKVYRTIITNEDEHRFIMEIVRYNEFESRLIHKRIVNNLEEFIKVY